MTWFFVVMGLFQVAQDIGLFVFLNNIPLFHPVPPVEVLFITWIYHSTFRSFLLGKFLWPISITYLIFAIVNTIAWQGLDTLPTNARTVESIWVAVIALTYFWLLITKLPIRKITRSSLFWLSCGLLFFFPGSLLISYYINDLLPLMQNIPILATWGIHSLLLMILYLFYSISVGVNEEEIQPGRSMKI